MLLARRRRVRCADIPLRTSPSWVRGPSDPRWVTCSPAASTEGRCDLAGLWPAVSAGWRQAVTRVTASHRINAPAPESVATPERASLARHAAARARVAVTVAPRFSMPWPAPPETVRREKLRRRDRVSRSVRGQFVHQVFLTHHEATNGRKGKGPCASSLTESVRVRHCSSGGAALYKRALWERSRLLTVPCGWQSSQVPTD